MKIFFLEKYVFIKELNNTAKKSPHRYLRGEKIIK